MNPDAPCRVEIGRQISVFIEDEPGTLARVAERLGARGINIFALTLSEGEGHGFVRMVVDRPAEAADLIRGAGELVSERDVLLLELWNRPGALASVAARLAAAGVNLEYAYCAGGPNVDRGLVIVRAEDTRKAAQVLAPSA